MGCLTVLKNTFDDNLFSVYHIFLLLIVGKNGPGEEKLVVQYSLSPAILHHEYIYYSEWQKYAYTYDEQSNKKLILNFPLFFKLLRRLPTKTLAMNGQEPDHLCS